MLASILLILLAGSTAQSALRFTMPTVTGGQTPWSRIRANSQRPLSVMSPAKNDSPGRTFSTRDGDTDTRSLSISTLERSTADFGSFIPYSPSIMASKKRYVGTKATQGLKFNTTDTSGNLVFRSVSEDEMKYATDEQVNNMMHAVLDSLDLDEVSDSLQSGLGDLREGSILKYVFYQRLPFALSSLVPSQAFDRFFF